MNIFKTFETFLKEPLSILKDNFIQIVSVQTGNIFANKPSCEVSVMKDKFPKWRKNKYLSPS